MEKGDRFGRLIVVEVKTKRYDAKKKIYRFTLVECECGVVKEVRRDHLSRGAVQSCGCLHKEVTRAANSTHGLSTSPQNHSVDVFNIPIPGKDDAVISVPKGLDVEDWLLLDSVLKIYIKRLKLWKDADLAKGASNMEGRELI